MKLDVAAYESALGTARLRLSSWQEKLHPRGEQGRFIDVLAAMAAGADKQEAVKAVTDTLYGVPQSEAADFDINGVKVTTRAGSGRFKDVRGNDIGFPSTAAYRIVDAAIERGAVQQQDAAPKPKAKKGVIRHELQDGTIAERRTHRPYTHVTTAVNAAGQRVVHSWHESEPNARKHVRRWEGHYPSIKIEKIRAPS